MDENLTHRPQQIYFTWIEGQFDRRERVFVIDVVAAQIARNKLERFF
jgi:hypothetical protein